ncbi:MAG: agmatinase [Endozoicomonadaceae bacterium]|nr:agmatinase [Endozoicomonadaceae bacterium]
MNLLLKPVDKPYYTALSSDQVQPDCVHLIGFEFDGTACFRKGAKAGPNAIRDVSDALEVYSPYLKRALTQYHYIDLGNILQPKSALNIEMTWHSMTDSFLQLLSQSEFSKTNTSFLTLGGEHSISYAPIKAYLAQYPSLMLLHLDAHADLRDGFEGYAYSHASIIRRVYDHFGPEHGLMQYGIRSGICEEYDWMQQHNTLYYSRRSFLEAIESIPVDRPIYLTLDLDYFDPSFLPGTGTPEPGGEDFHSFIQILKRLDHKRFVGADVVELSPKIDPTGNSEVFAAKIVRELMLCLQREKL